MPKGRYDFRQMTSVPQIRPTIAAPSQNEVVIADFTGHLTLLRLDTPTTGTRVFVGQEIAGFPINSTLRSLAITNTETWRCAVATSGAYAAVWNPESASVDRVESENGKVNAACWTDAADELLVGLGYFPLDKSVDPRAMVQLWAVQESDRKLLGQIAVPGCCVEALTFDAQEDEIVCFSGLRNQSIGFLTVLDSRNLRTKSVFEFEFGVVHDFNCYEQNILISDGPRIHMIGRDDGRIEWTVSTDDSSIRCAWDGFNGEIMTSNGQVLSPLNGKQITQCAILDGYNSVAARPEGGFVGVNELGTVGIWNRIE